MIIMIPMVLVQRCEPSILPQTEKKQESIIKTNQKVRVYIHEMGKVATLNLEEYVKGVVAGEMPAAFELEALKAQAVAARTYAISRVNSFEKSGHPDHPSAELCNTVHCQVWLSKEQLRKIKSKEWMKKYWPKIEKAVEETNGLIMTYENKPVTQPLFHSTSGGKTENSEDVFTAWVPYLRSVDSPYEKEAPHLTDKTVVPVETFVTKIKEKYKDCTITPSNVTSDVKIEQRSEGGRILKIRVGNKILTGREIRNLFGLRSANFMIAVKGTTIEFTTMGYGHGVGMSQWGANGMAKNGCHFDAILKHYYVGIELSKLP